jgi:PilZ domain
MGMGTTSDPINNPSQPSERERRRQERIHEPFPVTIRSVDASGEAFEIQTVLDNISASGFRVRLERHVKRGAKVFAIVRLSTSLPEVPAPRVAVRGVVLGVEPQDDGTWRVAVNFTSHRFL